MKASELRIGNYVLSARDGIIQISAPDIFDMSRGTMDDNIKPLDITQEWLLGFGFEKDIDNCDAENNDYIIYVNGKYFIIRKGYREDYAEYFTALYYQSFAGDGYNELLYDTYIYVHQLQNIVFALTREELKMAVDK